MQGMKLISTLIIVRFSLLRKHLTNRFRVPSCVSLPEKAFILKLHSRLVSRIFNFFISVY